MRMTTSQLRAKQIAELQAEQSAYDKRIEEAMQSAGYARCALAEDLYELLDIRPEHRTRKSRNGETMQVASDKDEAIRSARLLAAVGQLMEPATLSSP